MFMINIYIYALSICKQIIANKKDMRQFVLMRGATKYHHPNQQCAQVCACEEKETLPLGQHKLKAPVP